MPRATTNPYIVMLEQSLRRLDDVTVLNFSWRAALCGRYDVFHAHWPEILVHGNSAWKQLAKQALFVLFLIRLKLTRVAIVKTMHNLQLPSGISKVERLLLRALDRATVFRIRLNGTVEPEDGRDTVIVHGHYREWFESYPKSDPVSGRLAFVGLIRRYKSIDTLIRAFSELPMRHLSLRISGAPSSEELAQYLTSLASDDERVSFDFHFLTDAQFVEQVTESTLVVLPYKEMHNSGTVLAALSLNRPVLVPENAVNHGLSQEVGPGWVFTYEGSLTGADLAAALESAAQRSSDSPDLSNREWNLTGLQHARAYRQACQSLAKRP